MGGGIGMLSMPFIPYSPHWVFESPIYLQCDVEYDVEGIKMFKIGSVDICAIVSLANIVHTVKDICF